MAITILDQPTAVARVGQKLIVMAESTNVGQPNFRYVIVVSGYTETIGTYLVPPNPQNKLVFNIHDCLHQTISNPDIATNQYGDNQVSNTVGLFQFYSYTPPIVGYNVNILEGYDVDGVFTVDEASIISVMNEFNVTNFATFIASHKVTAGYKPSNSEYAFSYDAGILGSTKLLMGDRKPSTHYHDQSINRTPSNQQVFIPVRKSEVDFGCLNLFMQDSESYITSEINMKVRMTIFNSVGAPSSAALDIPLSDPVFISSLQVYPANLNAHGDLLRPADFPNWKYYTIALYDSTNTNRVSAEYVFYPMADDCRFDNVRLGWWSPIKGGWDFFNFSKKSEEVVEVERKRMKKVVGTYASDTFSFNPSDRETAEMVVDSTEYLNITSNWIQEGEFELLKSLVKSHSVYIINDDGTVVPVLVEDNSYTVRRDRTAKLYNQTFKLRYSQQYM